MDPTPSRTHNPSYVSKSTRMRIIYYDPYATDSSSDEKNHYVKEPMKRKRVVHEFAIPNLPDDIVCLKETMTNKNKICAKPTPLVKQPSSKCRGVRMRKSGNWVAEIRNPIKGTREWLGTFNTTKEASKAYEGKIFEFEAYEKRNKGFSNVVSTSGMSHASLSLLKSFNCVYNLIECGKISSNQPIVEINPLEGKFVEQNVPYISPLEVMQQLDVVGSLNLSPFELDWLPFDGLGQVLDDIDCLDDLQFCDFDKNGSIDLSDFNFGAEFVDDEEIDNWIEELSNTPGP